MNKFLKKKFKEFYNSFELNSANTLTFVVSIVALMISFKTCITSDRALEISERQSEPFLQISELKLIDSLNNISFLTIELTIKNLGQTPAINVSAEMDYKLGIVSKEKYGNSVTRRAIPNIGQSFETKIQLVSNRRNMRNWKTSGFRMHETLFFYGTLFYTNALS
jgi:hypothetical protein